MSHGTKAIVQVHFTTDELCPCSGSYFFLWNLESVSSLDMASERGKGKGKGAQRSSSRNAGQAVEIFAADVVPTSAAVLMLASVPPPPAPPAEDDAGALEASLTLASLSMPGLAAGALGPGEVAQLPGSPGTRADNPAAAESTAEEDKRNSESTAEEDKEEQRALACAWRP